MYLGRVMEIGSAAEVYGNPRHPYTQALLSAIPVVNPDVETQRERIMLTGDVPSPIDPPTGCVFHTRCPLRELLGNPEICVTDRPALDAVEGDADHAAACHFSESQELILSTPHSRTEKNASRLRQQ
jgi:oligopeptide/dipeptide ABC transporter ATP-binding protein